MHDRDENAAKNIYAEGLKILRVGTSTLGVVKIYIDENMEIISF